MRPNPIAVRSLVCLITSALGAPAAWAGSGDQPSRKDPGFAAQVEAHFDAWDYNRDGSLTFRETSQLVPLAGIRGEEAAALAAIHRIQRTRQWTEASFTRAELLATDGPDPGSSRPWFEGNYLECLAHIRATERVLFPRSGPSLRAFHQGVLGDCYFVAVVGAVVSRAPEQLYQVVRNAPEGSFEVLFPDRETVRVRHLSDAEIALGSSVGGHGLWLNVLEKAFGQMAEEVRRLQGEASEDAIDAVAQGGQPTRSLRILTGHEARSFLFRPEASAAGPSDSEAAALVAAVSPIVQENLRLRRLMTCDTPPTQVPPGLAPSHAYAVLGYEASSGLVHVWNPWGDDFPPQGKPGLEFGYAVQAGHFFVPRADFVRIFAALQYETAIPARLRW